MNPFPHASSFRTSSLPWNWIQRPLLGLAMTTMGWTAYPSAAWATTIQTELDPQVDTVALDFRNTGTSDNTVGGASRMFPDFRGTGRPGNHGSGASRGICPTLDELALASDDDERLTLLVPKEAKYGGYTTQASPTLWAYVPYILNEDSPITFTLRDDQGNSIYETFQTIEHEPGILKLDLPAHITLDIENSYEWYLMLHCGDPSGEDVTSFASGWIERVDSPAIPQGEDWDNLSLPERSNVYANQLIWYDALTVLAEGLLETPSSLELIDAWSYLLGLPSVQLEEVSTAPLSDCCSLPETPSVFGQ